MVEQYKRVWAEIDLDAARNNIEQIRKITSNEAGIMAVVKADAYGHGAFELAKVFLKYGADRLAVATIDEAEQLRLQGIDNPILILGCTHTSRINDIVKYDIIQAVFTYDTAKAISEESIRQNKIAKIHIKIDTGMGRIGFIPDNEAVKVIEKISKLKNLEIEGIFTHFATADEEDKNFTFEQFNKFTSIIKSIEAKGISIPIRHCANSAGIMEFPEMHLNMVRPGIILYGMYPSSDVHKNRLQLQPIMSLKASIVYVKEVPKGSSISYGRTYIAEKTTKIATVPIGYADGYPRMLSGKGYVIIRGKKAPIVGRVCMDQMMVDVTDIDDAQAGDEVILIGNFGKDISITAEDIANTIGTINYEITCMVSRRIPRVYVQNKRIVKIVNYLI